MLLSDCFFNCYHFMWENLLITLDTENVAIVIANNNVYGADVLALPLQEFTRFMPQK